MACQLILQRTIEYSTEEQQRIVHHHTPEG